MPRKILFLPLAPFRRGIRLTAKKIFPALAAVLFIILLALYPRHSLKAAQSGFQLWWNIVLPALFPFLVGSEVLMASGAIHYLSRPLEPITRRLFRLPGAAAFAIVAGYTSGFPAGAILSLRLYQHGLCSREEAERLNAFTNNASPLFITGVVAAGMLGLPAAGLLLALSHYGANLTIGFLWRFCPSPPPSRAAITGPSPPITVSGGTRLSEAIRRALVSLFNVGGYITLFSVLLGLLQATGILVLMEKILAAFLEVGGLPSELGRILAVGLWEITLGAKEAASSSLSLPEKLAAISFILGWGGLSVQSQVGGIIREGRLRLFPFVISRIGHCLLAFLYTRLLLPLFPLPKPAAFLLPISSLDFMTMLVNCTRLTFTAFAVLTLFALTTQFLKKKLCN